LLAIVLGRAPWVRLLGSRPMVFIGKRAYGFYLVQMLCLGVCIPLVKRVIPGARFDGSDIPVGHNTVLVSLVTLALGMMTTLAAADLLHRAFERPFIELGRSLTRRMTGHTPVAPARMTGDADLVEDTVADAPAVSGSATTTP
jgi:peptidoglycan/LPS O-acetylase OafA/YrhL